MTSRDDRIDVLTRALAFAFLTANPDVPLVFPLDQVRKYAEVLEDCGVKQTSKRAAAKIPDLPQWMRVDVAARQEALTVEQPVDPAAHPEGVARVGKAPKFTG